MPMAIELRARSILRATLLITFLMAVGHVAVEIIRFHVADGQTSGLNQLFNLEYERNVPTFWSSTLLLFASVLLAMLAWQIRREGGDYVIHWSVLSAAFLYLSLDEWLQLHERIMGPMQRLLPTDDGPFYYGWIIPAGILVAIMGLAYLKFLLRLPRRTAVLFLVSGVIYVGAAIGFEMLEGPLDAAGEWMNPTYSLLVGMEETLEMIGICLFAYAVIDYAARREQAAFQTDGTWIWHR